EVRAASQAQAARSRNRKAGVGRVAVVVHGNRSARVAVSVVDDFGHNVLLWLNFLYFVAMLKMSLAENSIGPSRAHHQFALAVSFAVVIHKYSSPVAFDPNP